MPSTSSFPRLFAAIFVLVVTVLAVLWFAFFRTTYAPVFQNIRENDASAIVAQFDTAGIPYRLENEGHDILVPQDKVAEARVSVAGANIAMGGTVGFELFNDSDMGLTEFAQKINFQRAMQGELARSIMMIDGIEFARVHLAIPERTIFREGQEAPTAVVSLETVPGSGLPEKKVAGIQQLVASAVPGLAVADVAVLDSEGNLVSTSPIAADRQTYGVMTERSALESYFAAKGRTAIAKLLPSLSFDIELSLRPLASEATNETPPIEASGGASSRQLDALRESSAFRILVRTPIELDPQERQAIQNALVDALQITEQRGDVLVFTTGSLAPMGASPAAPSPTLSSPPAPAKSTGEWDGDLFGSIGLKWPLIGLVLLLLVSLAAWPRRRLSDEEVASFADLLKDTATERSER